MTAYMPEILYVHANCFEELTLISPTSLFCNPKQNKTEAWTGDSVTGIFAWKYLRARMGNRSRIYAMWHQPF